METTKQDALKFYEISKYIAPYDICDLDKPLIVKSLMEKDFDDNLGDLQDFICEKFDDVRTLIEDDAVLKMYLNILKRGKRK